MTVLCFQTSGWVVKLIATEDRDTPIPRAGTWGLLWPGTSRREADVVAM